MGADIVCANVELRSWNDCIVEHENFIVKIEEREELVAVVLNPMAQHEYAEIVTEVSALALSCSGLVAGNAKLRASMF